MSIKEDWDKLDQDHKRFILRVRDSNGCKHGADSSYTKDVVLWNKAEKSGFIRCIGSFKWVVTSKYYDLEKELFGIENPSEE